MKIIIAIIAVIILSSQAYSQDLFGHQQPHKMQLLYVAKFIKTDTVISYDSAAHYTGIQGGTAIYNPYNIFQTTLVYDAVGAYRIEFGDDIEGVGLAGGLLPFFISNSNGFKTILQSNSPDCDCYGQGKKISGQIDVHVRTLNPSISGGELGVNGCIFTLFLYWVSQN